MYTFGMMVLKAITLTLTVAAAVSYYYRGASVTPFVLGITAVAAFAITFVVFMEHRNKASNMPTTPLSLLDHEEGSSALVLVGQLPERPIMWYKGEIFDFVHNDPTAPYLA